MSGSDERVEKDDGQRVRPGRRSLQDRQSAFSEILQGKATVGRVAQRLGVRAETVVGWRDAALAGREPVLPRASAERREGAPRDHVVTPLPNRRVAADFTTKNTVADGVGEVVLAVDCGCRSVLDVTVSKSQAAGPVLASVDRALDAAFGAPKNVPHGVELRTDHGPQSTGYDAEDLAAARGVTHTFAPVGRPTGNAVAERTIRTMKEECIWLRDWPDAETLRVALVAWAATFTDERPHQALDWQAPSERRAGLLGAPLPTSPRTCPGIGGNARRAPRSALRERVVGLAGATGKVPPLHRCFGWAIDAARLVKQTGGHYGGAAAGAAIARRARQSAGPLFDDPVKSRIITRNDPT